jgi:hypothetical protein
MDDSDESLFDDDISSDEEQTTQMHGSPGTPPVGASGFSIFTSKTLAEHRAEIFADVRGKLASGAADDSLSDSLSDDGAARARTVPRQPAPEHALTPGFL